MCVCVRARARACVRVYVCVCVHACACMCACVNACERNFKRQAYTWSTLSPDLCGDGEDER